MPTLRQIAQLGHPVLRSPAVAVSMPISDSVRTLAEEMMATMVEAEGVGIAAPQVYESSRIFIVASRPNARYPDAPLMEPEVMVNPEVVEASDEVVKGWEGCLSIPGLRGLVPRSRTVIARYRTLDGLMVERAFEGFVARVFLHELDHLDGLVFLDRLESLKDVVTEREYQRLSRESRAGGSSET